MADRADGPTTAEPDLPVGYICRGIAAIVIGCVVTIGTAFALVAIDLSIWAVLWSPLAGGMVTGALSPSNLLGSTLSGAVTGVLVAATMVGSFFWWAVNASPPTAGAGIGIVVTLLFLAALGVVLVLFAALGGFLGDPLRRACEHQPDHAPE